MLNTAPYSASSVEFWFGFLLLSGSTPTDHVNPLYMAGKALRPLLNGFRSLIRLWHSEELILAPSNLVVAGNYYKG